MKAVQPPLARGLTTKYLMAVKWEKVIIALFMVLITIEGTLKHKLFVPTLGYLNFTPPFMEIKARSLRYWMDFTDTQPTQAVKRGHVLTLLIPWEEFILTFVTTRTRKGY